jgi:hypothetical protein
MTCESIVHRESTPPVTEGISRRGFGVAGVATIVATFAAPAGAQELSPTPDNLERELPSPRQARRPARTFPHSQCRSRRACANAYFRVSEWRTSKQAAR